VQTGTPAGRIEQYAGVECYVTGSSKQAAIIYLTDIFGYKFINHQLLADKYAAAGFTVVIPNTLKSGPMSTDGYSVYAMEKFFEARPPHATRRSSRRSKADAVARERLTAAHAHF
jgi:dienelactone hydrolase